MTDFVIFSYDSYPKINVNLTGYIKSTNDFDSFINGWESLYVNNNDVKFTLIINTLSYNSSLYDLKYCYSLIQFLNKIKEKRLVDKNYNKLKHSIIIVNNTITRYLLEFIFSFQTPLANIYIVETIESAEYLYYNFENNIENNYFNVSIIKV
jgi:hypothetical protein